MTTSGGRSSSAGTMYVCFNLRKRAASRRQVMLRVASLPLWQTNQTSFGVSGRRPMTSVVSRLSGCWLRETRNECAVAGLLALSSASGMLAFVRLSKGTGFSGVVSSRRQHLTKIQPILSSPKQCGRINVWTHNWCSLHWVTEQTVLFCCAW